MIKHVLFLIVILGSSDYLKIQSRDDDYPAVFHFLSCFVE